MNRDELMKYKKAELINVIESRENTIENLKKYIEKQTDMMKCQRERFERVIDEMEDARYKHWKSLNEEFMLRYMKEFIQQKLFLEFNESYSGYFSLELKVNGETLNTLAGCINMSDNGLEE